MKIKNRKEALLFDQILSFHLSSRGRFSDEKKVEEIVSEFGLDEKYATGVLTKFCEIGNDLRLFTIGGFAYSDDKYVYKINEFNCGEFIKENGFVGEFRKELFRKFKSNLSLIIATLALFVSIFPFIFPDTKEKEIKEFIELKVNESGLKTENIFQKKTDSLNTKLIELQLKLDKSSNDIKKLK